MPEGALTSFTEFKAYRYFAVQANKIIIAK